MFSEKYWRISYKPDNKITYKDALEEIKYLVEKSVQRTLISDVPLSIMLSGGIDSAVILGIAKKKFNQNFKSFSIIDNDLRYNETKNIELTRKFNKNQNIKLKLAENLKIIFLNLRN